MPLSVTPRLGTDAATMFQPPDPAGFLGIQANSLPKNG